VTSDLHAAPDSPWLEVARGKLVRVLGPERAAAVLAEVLAELGLDTLATVDDLHAFGERLARRDGFLAVLGTALQTHALLRRTRAKLG
jgi:hypothetical protein